MYPKFKEIALDTATWTVAFLGAIEERETKSKKPFCTFHLLDGDIAITANLWNTEKFHFGDWLFFRPDDDKDGIAAITDKNMIAQCFFAHSMQMLINAAQVLGKTDDVKLYSDLLSKGNIFSTIHWK